MVQNREVVGYRIDRTAAAAGAREHLRMMESCSDDCREVFCDYSAGCRLDTAKESASRGADYEVLISAFACWGYLLTSYTLADPY